MTLILPNYYSQPKQTDNRTLKQPVVWRCPNPECFILSTDRYYEFVSEYAECPKCGCKEPHVQQRTLIHLLVRDDKGPIVGMYGMRYKLLCDERRAYLATIGNNEGATGDAAAANCAGCLKLLGDRLGFKNGVAVGM